MDSVDLVTFLELIDPRHDDLLSRPKRIVCVSLAFLDGKQMLKRSGTFSVNNFSWIDGKKKQTNPGNVTLVENTGMAFVHR